MMSANLAISAPVSVAHESESSGWRDAAGGATFPRLDGGSVMPTPVIVSATRTAIGTLGGALAQTPATKLGGVAVREAMRRARLEPAQVDEVILGHVLPAGLGLNPGRVAALDGGVPKEVPSFTVNKACGSGLKAVVLAAPAIQLGDADVIVAGGMESMSGAPYISKKARFGVRMGHEELLDSMIADGLTCPITFVHMGVTAENIAAKYGITREEQDEFAAESQQRTAAAQQAGKFKAEIVPVEIPAKKGETLRFDTDEHPRADTTAQRLAGLKPAFKRDGGTVTAGNASGINDGAAAVVVMSDRKAKELRLTPLATIRAYAAAGVDPGARRGGGACRLPVVVRAHRPALPAPGHGRDRRGASARRPPARHPDQRDPLPGRAGGGRPGHRASPGDATPRARRALHGRGRAPALLRRGQDLLGGALRRRAGG